MSDPQQSWWFWLGVLGFFLALWLLYALWQCLERRGIIKPSRRLTTGVGNALFQANKFLRPSQQYIEEAKQERKAEEKGEGDPPNPLERG
jgi:hypothetical protein